MLGATYLDRLFPFLYVQPIPERVLSAPGKAGGFTIAGPSKGPDRNRSKSKPRTIHCSVFRKSSCCRHSCQSRNLGFPEKTGIQSLKWFPVFSGTTSGFLVVFHLPGMTILHSRNCQTLGVPRRAGGLPKC